MLRLFLLLALLSGCRKAVETSIVVDIDQSGANASEVEASATLPLEVSLSQAHSIACVSRENTSRCAAIFKKQASPVLPESAMINRETVLQLDVKASRPPGELIPVVDQIVTALEVTRGVSAVRVENRPRREIVVRVDAERARSLGLTPADVASVLRNAPGDFGAVEVRRAPVVLVKDVATMEDAILRDGDGPISISVDKGSSASTAEVQGAVIKALDGLSLPPDVTLQRVPAHETIAIFLADGAEPGLGDIDGLELLPLPKDDIQRTMTIDNARANALGVNPADAHQAIRFALAGDVVNKTSEGVPVRVSQPVDETAPLGTQISVMTKTGALVFLAQVAEEKLAAAPTVLYRHNRARARVVCAKAKSPDVVKIVRERLGPTFSVESGALAQVCR